MMPRAPQVSPVTADQWARAAVPLAVTRVVLPLAWVAALAAAAFGDTTPCSAADPSLCGPDQAFAFWITIAFATPVLLWWKPLLGCGAGIAFAAADLIYDDVASARIGFGLHGAACAAVAVWMVRSARMQRAIAGTATDGVTASVATVDARVASRWNSLPLAAAAGLLLLVAPVMTGIYQHRTAAEQAHLDRAVTVQGDVTQINEADGTITVVPRPIGDIAARTQTIGVLEADDYQAGTSVPVLVDPADADWLRLVAEPADETYWLSFAYGACLLAGVLLGQEIHARRARTRLMTGRHPALAVRAVPDENGDAVLLPAADAAPFARLAVLDAALQQEAVGGRGQHEDELDWTPQLEASFGRAWRGESTQADEDPFPTGPPEPEDAVLIGDLRYGGWTVLITEDEVLLPAAPLRRPASSRPRPAWLSRWLRRASPDSEDEVGSRLSRGELPGTPVPARRPAVEPELPLSARAPGRRRLVGGIMIIAAFVGAPSAEVWFAGNWYERILAVVLACQLLAAGLSRAVQGVTVTRQRLRIDSGTVVHEVPWGRLHGVRLLGDRLVLAWEPDVIMEVGPFAGPRTALPGDVEQLGALLSLLRERSALGPPPEPWRRRPGPLWPLLGVLILLSAAGAWIG